MNKNKNNLDTYNDLNKLIYDTTDIMKENVNKIIERDVKIDTLEETANNLSDNSSKFLSKSKHLKRKYCCKNIKLILIIICIVIIISLILFGIIYSLFK